MREELLNSEFDKTEPLSIRDGDMPEKLKTFLKSLTLIEAKEIADYLPTLAYLWEVNDILDAKIKEIPDFDDESIFEDRDSTSIHQ